MKPESLARRTRKRRPKALDLRALSRVLTTALTALEDDLLAATDPEEKRRAASVLAQVAGVYTKVISETDWQDELAKVKEELRDATTRLSRPTGTSQGPSSTRPN